MSNNNPAAPSASTNLGTSSRILLMSSYLQYSGQLIASKRTISIAKHPTIIPTLYPQQILTQSQGWRWRIILPWHWRVSIVHWICYVYTSGDDDDYPITLDFLLQGTFWAKVSPTPVGIIPHWFHTAVFHKILLHDKRKPYNGNLNFVISNNPLTPSQH